MMRIAVFLLLGGCLITCSSVVYGQCDSFSVELLPIYPTCESVQNGALNVSVTGATPPVDYSWADGASEGNRTGLGTGLYEVTVTDADGCSATEHITLTGLMELELGNDTTLYCEDEVLVLQNDVAAPNSIYFAPYPDQDSILSFGELGFFEPVTSNGYISSEPPINTPPTTGFDQLHLYATSAQASAGDTACISIRVDNFENIGLLNFTVKHDPSFSQYLFHQNISTDLFALFPSSIMVNQDSSATQFSWSGLLAGLFSLPDGSTLFEICFQVQGNLGNYEYEWAGPDGFSADTSVITATTTGTYSLTLTESGNSGCVLQDSVQVIFDDGPKIEMPDTLYTCTDSVRIAPEVSCAGDDPSYAWSTGAISESITVLPGSPQQYSLTVTSDSGLSRSDTVVVIPSDAPVLEPINDITLCSDEFSTSVTATVNGGLPPYTFAWNGTIEGQTAVLSPLGAAAKPFETIVFDSLGCSDTTAFTIFTDSFSVEFPVHIASLCVGATELEPVVTDTTGSPVYVWNTGETDRSITVSNPGIYYVTVQNGNGCVLSDSVTVVESELVLDVFVEDNICAGASEGCVIVQVGGGNSPYDYQWSDGQVGNQRCNLPAGTYTVIVTDANGCQAEITADVGEPEPLGVILIEEQPPSCINAEDGQLSVQGTGGTPPYFYSWSFGLLGQNLSGLAPGNYFIAVTDINGCTAISQYLLEPASDAEVLAEAGLAQTITCLSPVATLDGTGSSVGSNYIYEWVGPFGESYTDLTIGVETPGQYTLFVTNTDVPGCTASDTVLVEENLAVPNVDLNFILLNCDSARLTYTSDIEVSGLSWELPDGSIRSSDTIVSPLPGTYLLNGEGTENGCGFSASVVLPDFPEDCITLEGQLLHDTTANCQIETGEPGLSNWLISITGGGQAFYAVTQEGGQYRQQIPQGEYLLSPILPSNGWQPCQPGYAVSAAEPGDTVRQDLQVQTVENCPEFEVDVSLPIMRRCWERTLWVNYCNIGTAEANEAFVTVLLDEQFTFLDASLPLLNQEGLLYTFDIGTVPVNGCGSFSVKVEVSCNAAVGEALCVEAKAFPNEPCAPPSGNWSGASLQVSASCENGEEVVFHLTNEGADMVEGQHYIVIEDGVMLLVMPDSIRLDAQEQYEFRLPATGATYRIEAEQVPFHPEVSSPVSVIEGCGTDEFGSFSTGFVNQFDLGDEDPFVDVDCREIVAAYDPNDKRGFPLGHGPEGLIYAGTELEYQIRFQNTGNDTAFLVVIKDTIDTAVLNLETVRPGASSHPYHWDIEDENTLVFTFDNILLPDSMTNELESQGFVDFKIEQQPGLQPGTVIDNRAGIYFDINPPILTNTSRHTLGSDFLEVITHTVSPTLQSTAVKVIPNPAREAARLHLQDWPGEGGLLELYGPTGQLILRRSFTGRNVELQRQHLPAGWYSFRIIGKQAGVFSGRLIWR